MIRWLKTSSKAIVSFGDFLSHLITDVYGIFHSYKLFVLFKSIFRVILVLFGIAVKGEYSGCYCHYNYNEFRKKVTRLQSRRKALDSGFP